MLDSLCLSLACKGEEVCLATKFANSALKGNFNPVWRERKTSLHLNPFIRRLLEWTVGKDVDGSTCVSWKIPLTGWNAYDLCAQSTLYIPPCPSVYFNILFRSFSAFRMKSSVRQHKNLCSVVRRTWLPYDGKWKSSKSRSGTHQSESGQTER